MKAKTLPNKRLQLTSARMAVPTAVLFAAINLFRRPGARQLKPDPLGAVRIRPALRPVVPKILDA